MVIRLLLQLGTHWLLKVVNRLVVRAKRSEEAIEAEQILMDDVKTFLNKVERATGIKPKPKMLDESYRLNRATKRNKWARRREKFNQMNRKIRRRNDR